MSSVPDPITRTNESRNEGLKHEPKAAVDPSLDADMASSSAEEGEIRDDSPTDKGELQRDHPVEEVRPVEGSHRVEEGRIQDNHAIGEKRKRSTSHEDKLPSKRVESLVFPKILSFDNIRHPGGKMPCFISVGGLEAFGSLYPMNQGLTIFVYIEVGHSNRGVPSVQLSFRDSEKVRGPDIAHHMWDMNTSSTFQYQMDNIKHDHVRTGGPNLRVSNRKVLDGCRLEHESNLVYMMFESHAQKGGWSQSGAFIGREYWIQRELNLIFKPKKPYTLELWFIAPRDARLFQRDTLNVFTDLMNARVHHFSGFKDRQGVLFNDRYPLLRPTDKVRGASGNPTPTPPTNDPDSPLHVPSRVTQRTVRAQGMTLGSSTTANQRGYPDPPPYSGVPSLGSTFGSRTTSEQRGYPDPSPYS